MCMSGVHRDQKKTLDTLELELGVVESGLSSGPLQEQQLLTVESSFHPHTFFLCTSVDRQPGWPIFQPLRRSKHDYASVSLLC